MDGVDGLEEARRKCTHEAKTFFHRWENESDLGSQLILESVNDAIDEYYEVEEEEEEVLEFEADDSILEDD